LLDVIESTQKPVTYYALDLSYESLQRQLEKLDCAKYEHVKCVGLCGTFEDVRGWAAQRDQPVFFMSLGSIFGNDDFDIAVQDLRLWSDSMREGDRMLIGLDACQDNDRIWRSYNTKLAGKPTMVEHALELSNTLLGHTWYRPEQWDITGVTEKLEHVSTHQWIAQATVDVHCEALQLQIPTGEQIRTTKWFKWGPDGISRQLEESQLRQISQWKSPTGPFCKHDSSHPINALS
jgi:uncharacterized SAM-dependent methyltransferase